jgi:hypothetical protein
MMRSAKPHAGRVNLTKYVKLRFRSRKMALLFGGPRCEWPNSPRLRFDR